jgi:serine phosphatase RsbU (regulator of sigma subunit)/ligand-binding sensor domain-containing protein
MRYLTKNQCLLDKSLLLKIGIYFFFKDLFSKYLIFIFCLFISHSVFAQNDGNLFIKNYSPQQYRAAIQNWAIVQDHRGILYTANDQGVLEYDGQNWILIKTTNQSAVRSLSLDKEGRVYVGGSDEFGFLAPDKLGRTKYVSLSKSLPKDKKNFGDVWSTHVTSQGVCFQTDQFLFLYHPERNDFSILPAFVDSYFFLAFWVNQKLYVFDQEYGLHQLENGKLSLAQGGEQLINKRIYALLPHLKGELLVGTYQSGLLRYRPEATKDSIFTSFKTEVDNYLAKKQLYSATVLTNDEIALCTRSGGIAIISQQGKLREIIDQSGGIADNNVHYAFLSREGALWLALDNGISQIDYFLPIRFWNNKKGLEGTIKDIYVFKNQLYIASSLGVFYQKGNQFYPVKSLNTQTWSLLAFRPDAKNELLLVSSNQGIFQIEGDVAFPVYLTQRTAALKLYASPSNPSILYVGLKGGLLRMNYQKGSWVNIQEISPIKSEIYTIAEEKPNVLWLGTFIEGVVRAELNPNYALAKVQTFGEKEGLPSLRGNQVYRVRDKVYIGTSAGLYTYSTASKKLQISQDFGKALGSRKYGVHSLTIDPVQNIWVANNNNQFQAIGVARKLTKKGYVWEDRVLRSLPEFNEIVLHADTSYQIWLGGSEGLFRYNPKEKFNINAKVNVLIRKITLKEDSLIFGGSFYDDSDRQPVAHSEQTSGIHNVFQYSDNNSIEFYVAAPFYIRNEAIEYRYRIQESPSNWIEQFLVGMKTPQWSGWTKESKRPYTNLSEGTYLFYVQARNVYGTTSEVVTFSFEILPPWYRSIWAYFMYFILSILIVGVSIRLYTIRLRQQKKHLEQVIQARTLEISQKNEVLSNQQAEIIEQSESLAEKNQEITSSINYARRIQEAMLPHLSAIKKSFPESFILYEPRDIVSGDFYWFTETNLEPRYTKEPTLKNTPSIFRGFAEGKKIIAAVDCTGHGVPGAFMSMVGDAYLNQIINSEVITQPQLILKELDNYVRNGLKQKETSNLDGMDMTICVIDPNLKTLSFAGAKNPLIYIQDGNLHQIRGDKLGIGGFIFDESPKEFTRHVISIDKPTWFYIFSDGYQDQFGGKKGKKFMIRNLKELLLDNHQKPMEEQSLLLKEALIDWMQGYKQVDDILVIGAYLDPEKL